jgi:hypothetical protein
MMQDLWCEDLPSQARRGFELGSALCACEGHYHTLWGALRTAGLNNTMKGEAQILASMMAPFLRGGARVMIGGSADPGVLCGIGRIYAPQMPIWTVIDKCRAPLAVIGEFSSMKGLACRTLNLDLLELDGSEQWDQIVLHYTPDFMEATVRSRLFRSLAASLAPGGVVVCATMTGASIPFDRKPELEAAFLARAVAALENTMMAEYAATPRFAEQLRSYTACRMTRRLRLPTAEGVCDLMEQTGLQILDKHVTSRQRQLLADMEVIDTSTIIIAGRS